MNMIKKISLVFCDLEINDAQFKIVYPLISNDKETFKNNPYEWIKIEVLNQILNNRLGFQFNNDIFDGFVSSKIHAQYQSNWIEIEGRTPTESIANKIAVYQNTVKRLHTKTIEPYELQMAIDSIRTRIDGQFSDPNLVLQLIDSLPINTTLEQHYSSLMASLDDIEATDIRSLAKKHLLSSDFSLFVVGRQANLMPGLLGLVPDKKVLEYNVEGNLIKEWDKKDLVKNDFFDPQTAPNAGSKRQRASKQTTQADTIAEPLMPIEVSAKPATNASSEPIFYQTADEQMLSQRIIKNYIEAVGGEKQLKKMIAITRKTSVKIKDFVLESTETMRTDNSYRQNIFLNNVLIVEKNFDGKKGQIKTLDKVETEFLLSDFQLLEQQIVLPIEMNYKKLDAKMYYLGVDTSANEILPILRFTLPNGSSITNYYANQTGLKKYSIVETPTGQVVRMDYDNYLKIDELYFPLNITKTADGKTTRYQVTEIKLNEK